MARKYRKGEIVYTHIALSFFSILAIFPVIWILIASFTPRYDIPGLSKKIVRKITFQKDPGKEYFKEIDDHFFIYQKHNQKLLKQIQSINTRLRMVRYKKGKFNSISNDLKKAGKDLAQLINIYKDYNIKRITFSREIKDKLADNQPVSQLTTDQIEGLITQIDDSVPAILKATEKL
ncbi:MAG: hypothetical protein MJB14_21215, partial [Spirochaetes bacterium]|nr:hypothetical protein [Spirochaetota bacterium]